MFPTLFLKILRFYTEIFQNKLHGFLRNLFKLLRTNSSEKAHDQQDDDTPEHIYIHLSLQFTALVAGTVIVEHGFGLMACEETQHVSSNWSEVNDGER